MSYQFLQIHSSYNIEYDHATTIDTVLSDLCWEEKASLRRLQWRQRCAEVSVMSGWTHFGLAGLFGGRALSVCPALRHWDLQHNKPRYSPPVNPSYWRAEGESHFSVLPLPLSHVRVRASSGFDRGVGVRGRGRYPLKPSMFVSVLETKGTQNTLIQIIQRVFSA